MNNFEKITEMTKDELAEFINELIRESIDKTEPFKWFDETYCKICPDIEVEYKDEKELWKECYFEGKCPHQDWGIDLIKLWLEDENEKI